MSKVRLYSADGEEIAVKPTAGSPLETNADIEQGESRVYSTSFEDCESVDRYEIELRSFRAPLPSDEIEGEVKIHPGLEGKLEVVEHNFSWADADPGGGYHYVDVAVENVTSDHIISVTADTGAYRKFITEIEPGETVRESVEGTGGLGRESYELNLGQGGEADDESEMRNHWGYVIQEVENSEDG